MSINSPFCRVSILALALLIAFSPLILRPKPYADGAAPETSDSRHVLACDASAPPVPAKKYVPPYLEANASASPGIIWPESSKGEPKLAKLSLTLSGSGGPAIAFKPQDTVFVMDCSQSMRYISDPNDLRLRAAQHYVDNMIPPDRCAVVRFSSGANLVNGHALTSNYSAVSADLDSLYGSASGQTNFESAFAVATDELVANGSGSHVRMEIFLTDGRPEPESTNITMNTMAKIVQNNITVFTIYLGPAKDSSLLEWIANSTGGRYYNATNASVLDSIYMDIANQFRDYTAAYGGGVSCVLPGFVHYANESASMAPKSVRIDLDGITTLSWSLDKIMLGGWWNVSFNVSSNRTGWVSLFFVPDSRGDYINWNHTGAVAAFPETNIWVVPPAPVPPPVPVPPPAPPSFVPVPPPALMAPVAQAAITVQPVFSLTSVAQPTGISTAELIAPFMALGLGSFAKLRKKVKMKKKINIGVREGRRNPGVASVAEGGRAGMNPMPDKEVRLN